MQIPERVRAESEIPANKHFDIQAVFDDEQTRLSRWLESEANEAVSSATATETTAERHCETLLEQLRGRYADVDENLDRELLSRASDGTLAKYVPNRGAVSVYRALKWIALTAEILVGIGVWLLAEGTPVLILVAVMLALAGWLAGKGVGSLLERRLGHILPPELGAPAAPSPVSGVLMTVIGFLTIIGLSYLRAAGDEGEGVVYVVGFTLLLAILIAIFEALHSFFHHKYDFLHKRMALSQRWYANRRHATQMDAYRKTFMNKVKNLLDNTRQLPGMAGAASR